jgi:hypothetical protein
MLLNSLSRKRSKVAITAAVAVGIVFLSAAPAMAVGQKTVNGYTGKSWQDSSCDDYLCAFTLDQTGTGNHTVSVQGLSGGVVTGPKITASGLASVDEHASYYLPGGKHWGPGTTFTT